MAALGVLRFLAVMASLLSLGSANCAGDNWVEDYSPEKCWITGDDIVMSCADNFNGGHCGMRLHGKPHLGSGAQSVTMKTAPGAGVATSFYLATYGFDNDRISKPWNEVDFEIIGFLTNSSWTMVWSNFYTGKGVEHVKQLFLPFDASADFHTYTIDTRNNTLTWLVDGIVYRSEDISAEVDFVAAIKNWNLQAFVSLWGRDENDPARQQRGGFWDKLGLLNWNKNTFPLHAKFKTEWNPPMPPTTTSTSTATTATSTTSTTSATSTSTGTTTTITTTITSTQTTTSTKTSTTETDTPTTTTTLTTRSTTTVTTTKTATLTTTTMTTTTMTATATTTLETTTTSTSKTTSTITQTATTHTRSSTTATTDTTTGTLTTPTSTTTLTTAAPTTTTPKTTTSTTAAPTTTTPTTTTPTTTPTTTTPTTRAPKTTSPTAAAPTTVAADTTVADTTAAETIAATTSTPATTTPTTRAPKTTSPTTVAPTTVVADTTVADTIAAAATAAITSTAAATEPPEAVAGNDTTGRTKAAAEEADDSAERRSDDSPRAALSANATAAETYVAMGHVNIPSGFARHLPSLALVGVATSFTFLLWRAWSRLRRGDVSGASLADVEAHEDAAMAVPLAHGADWQ